MDELEKEMRAGVSHFVPGQVRAATSVEDDGTIIGLVINTDQMGWAWITLVAKEDGAWTAAFRSKWTATGVRGEFEECSHELPPSHIAALDLALDEKR